MGFIYQEANAYGVEALVALERHYTPTEEKYCTAVTEAVRICDTYGIPERELVPQVRHIAAAEEYLLEHLSEDEETLQFLFTPLSGSNTCLAWFLVWDYVRPGGEKAYKYTGHTPQQRLRDIISAVGHEPDVTIADFVADARASTPSNAAEIAVPDQVELLRWLRGAGERMARSETARLEAARQRLTALAAKRGMTDGMAGPGPLTAAAGGRDRRGAGAAPAEIRGPGGVAGRHEPPGGAGPGLRRGPG